MMSMREFEPGAAVVVTFTTASFDGKEVPFVRARQIAASNAATSYDMFALPDTREAFPA